MTTDISRIDGNELSPMQSSLHAKVLSFDFPEGSDGDALFFIVTDKGTLVFCHYQDCCESVCLEEIVGDKDSLIGEEILLAEEVSSGDEPAPEYGESFTWTFYKIQTMNGDITLRFLGTSNGYYSEAVDVRWIPNTFSSQKETGELNSFDIITY